MEGLTPVERAIARHDARRPAAALAYRLLADFIRHDTEGPVPLLNEIHACAAPPGAGREAGCAAVDRWAERHAVTPGWKDGGTYEASVSFGALRYTVFFLPAREYEDRVTIRVPADAEAAPEMAEAAA